MATSLQNETPAAAYGQLLHVEGGVTGTLKTVYDGNGTATALQISTTAIALSGLDATSIANGSVSNAEFETLDGVTSAIQGQINGKQPLATVLTNTTAAFTTAQETKLAGIASGATANSSDAVLLARANHTGSQAISTVTGLQTSLDAKAPLASPTFTGTVAGITAAMVGAPSGSGTSSGANTGDQTSVTGNAGTVTTINGNLAAGTNITLDGAGTIASPYVINSAGGGATFTTVEKNLGTTPRMAGKFTITGLSGLSIGKPVNIFKAVAPYTGKGTRADEAEMDSIVASASVTAVDTITAYWNSATRVKGNIKFNYIIGA